MKWIQDNPFLAGLSVVTALGLAVLLFLLNQSATQYQEVSDQYTQAVQKLHGLQNRSPFPSRENYEKSAALAEEYKTELQTIRRHLAAMEVPLNPDIKPQQFQDDLRSAVNATTEKAAAAGVALPTDFYLGFGQYANSLPSERAAPALARQLVVIQGLINRLIDFKITSIDTLDRRLLPEESPTPPDPKKPEPILQRYPFDLAFTAEQAKFRVIFNSLLADDQFLLVRALSILNSEPAGPPIAQAATPAASTSLAGNTDAFAQSPETTPAGLEVILGRELVKVSLRIEILDFAEHEEPKK